jgi:hypothetical protein
MQPQSPWHGGELFDAEETVVVWHCDFAQAEDFGLSNFRIADSSARDQCFEHQISRRD